MHKDLLENINFIYSLLDKLHEGVVIHSSDTTIMYANEAASMILGLSKDQIVGRNAMDEAWYFVDQEHKPLSKEQYPVNLIFSNNENIDHYLVGIHLPDESIRWVDVNGSAVLINEHQKAALIMFSDVTERKIAYEEAALFKKLIEVVDAGVTISDPMQDDNPLVYVNPAFSAMTGYSRDEAIGKNCRYLQGENREQEGRYIIANAIQNQIACDTELLNYTKEGKPFYNLLTLSPLFEHEKLRYFVGVQHNITRLKEQELLLREQNLYIQSLLDAQEDIVVVSNGEKLLYCNQAFLDFFGIEQLEEFLKKEACICSRFINNDPAFYVPDDTTSSWIEAIMKLSPNQRAVAIQNYKSEVRYFEVALKVLHADRYIITFGDVTHSIIKERILAEKAYHDPLTSAYNRQFFYEYLSHDSTLTGVIMIDLDNFKSVNDTYGHAVGDLVLIETVKTISASIRKEDYIIRWGGEEIVVLSRSQDVNQLKRMAENIRHKIESNPIDKVGKITASLGTAMILEGIENAIEKADEALYEAKKMGKNRALHYDN